MKELIKQWQEFIKWWIVNGYKIRMDGVDNLTCPQFDDFMDWLAENYRE